MKSKRSFILKAGLALVLCFILLVGTMTVGLAAIRDELASTGWPTSNSGIVFKTLPANAIYANGNALTSGNVSGLNGENGYLDFDVLIAGNYQYQVLFNGKWFGETDQNRAVFSDSNAGSYLYYCDNNYSSDYLAAATFPKGQYVLKLNSGNTDYATSNYYLYRKKYSIDYGWDGGSWDGNNTAMEYQGDSVYKLTISGTGKQLRFRPKKVEGTGTGSADTEDGYYPSSNDNIRDNVAFATGYTVSTGSSSNYWYVDTEVGAQYHIWLKKTNDVGTKVWLTISGETPGYYLTGNINNTDTNLLVNNALNSYAFSTTDTEGVYTLTTRFTNDNGNYQYVNISTKTGYVYYPATNHAGTGTASSRSTPDTVNDVYATKGSDGSTDVDKWKLNAPTGTIFTFTWDTRLTEGHPKPTLSWEQVKAKYEFVYKNRNGQDRTYTVTSTVDPTLAEYNNGGTLSLSTTVETGTRGTEISNSLTGLNSALSKAFNKTYTITYASLGDADTSTPYVLKYNIESFASETKRTFNVYTYDDNGDLSVVTPYQSAVFNSVVEIPNSLIVNRPDGYPSNAKFIGWYEYSDGSFVGDVISTHPNFGFTVTRPMNIAPVFDSGNNTHYTNAKDADGAWHSYIDYNQFSMEMDSDSTGTLYNDNIIRFRKGGTDSAQRVSFTDDATECGIIIFAQPNEGVSDENKNIFTNTYKEAQMLTVLKNLKAKTLTAAKYSATDTYMYYIPVTSLSTLNRVNIVQTLDYYKFNGGRYKVMAYMLGADGETYYHSDLVSGNYS